MVLIQCDWCPLKRRSRHRHTEGRPHEDTGGDATYTPRRQALGKPDLLRRDCRGPALGLGAITVCATLLLQSWETHIRGENNFQAS